jgi:adenosine deaminase
VRRRSRGGGISILLITSSSFRDAAKESVDLATEFRDAGVVGVDISGNPRVSYPQFEPFLRRARGAGLPLAVHFAEVPDPVESAAILALRPDRLGHACYLNDKEEAALLSSRIPVEICMTSNLRSRSVPSYEAHHFRRLHAAGHPLVLCTDDPGVFHTTLASEYQVAAQIFSLTKQQLLQLAVAPVEFCFADTKTKERLRATFAQFAKSENLE